MVRVLVATDGSGPAAIAVRLAAELAATPGSVLRAVSVVAGGLGSIGGTLEGADAVARHELALREARTIAGRRDVQLDLRRGDVPAEVVRGAEEFGADVVVIGSRAFGPVATALLGSVSAAVADAAPCPVLVVRCAAIEPVVLATDGSEPALDAERVLHWWPRRTPSPVEVVAVRRPRLPGAIHVPGLPHGAGDPDGDDVHDAPADAASLAAARLAAWGIPARPVTLFGDPASRIVQAAHAGAAGLIVVGTHGRTGLTRLLLGSVAHSVLTHAHCSVLVVRPTPGRVRAAEREQPVGVGAAAGAG